jgi:hypothetical protein
MFVLEYLEIMAVSFEQPKKKKSCVSLLFSREKQFFQNKYFIISPTVELNIAHKI